MHCDGLRTLHERIWEFKGYDYAHRLRSASCLIQTYPGCQRPHSNCSTSDHGLPTLVRPVCVYRRVLSRQLEQPEQIAVAILHHGDLLAAAHVAHASVYATASGEVAAAILQRLAGDPPQAFHTLLRAQGGK